MPGVQVIPVSHKTDVPANAEEAFLAECRPADFARFLAKVELGFAVAELGLDNIAEDFVGPSIRGRRQDIGQWVGCMSHSAKRGQSKVLHAVDVGLDDDLILVRIHLLASLNAPEYFVVVGRVSTSLPEAVRNQLAVNVSFSEGPSPGAIASHFANGYAPKEAGPPP